MSHLDYIVSEVKANGKHEEPWNVLLNAYFRGEDGFRDVEFWASSVGLLVKTSNQYKTFTFLPSVGL